MLTGSPNILRKYNQDLIRRLIHKFGPITKPELSKISHLSVPTVNKIVDDLLGSEILCLAENNEGNVGRKAQKFMINPDKGRILVLYYQDRTMTTNITDFLGQNVFSAQDVDKSTDLPSFLSFIDEKINHFLDMTKEKQDLAVCVGIPGVVSSQNLILNIPSKSYLEGFNLKNYIEKKFNLSTFVENDVNLKTIGFFNGEVKGKYDNFVYIYISEGFGSGIIIKGDLFKGYSNFAGEFGHMPIIKNRLNDFVRLSPIEKEYNSLIEKILTSQIEEEEAFQKYIPLLSVILCNFISVINPGLIALQAPKINEESITALKEELMLVIPEDAIPVLKIAQEKKYGLDGAFDYCLDNFLTSIHIVHQKGY